MTLIKLVGGPAEGQLMQVPQVAPVHLAVQAVCDNCGDIEYHEGRYVPRPLEWATVCPVFDLEDGGARLFDWDGWRRE